ncbi:hypothetical protein [Actinoplanes sp. NPDC049118]|uniref:hypothetical protein n=1 Tax=Actinoplanes sp. NPDC049118 TaxID=3155769 RepID=UPI0033E6BE47
MSRDLVWNHWVNNYLLGHRLPTSDVLFWNADTIRTPARPHADFARLAMDNSLAAPGAMTVLGGPVDLSQLEVDTYLVPGIADYLTPWQNGYHARPRPTRRRS